VTKRVVRVGNMKDERDARAALAKAKSMPEIAAFLEAGTAAGLAGMERTREEAEALFAESLATLTEAICEEAGRPGFIAREEVLATVHHAVKDQRAKAAKRQRRKDRKP
jgi:hypothetical protein